jgi:Clp amino terminal domain, pathogenicity island component
MFERFNEKARRAVFFARYEASHYGSSYIDTAHLLLGLWREDLAVRAVLRDTEMDSEVRAEVERSIERGKPLPTSVEIPLSADGKKALLFAAEEADRLGQRHVGTEHMLLGLLRVKDSVGARIVRARGVLIDEFRERLAKGPQPVSLRKSALPILEHFLAGLKRHQAESLMEYFAKNAEIVDVHGQRWKYDEIAVNFEILFAPYAKKNAAHAIEDVLVDSDEHLVAVVLWKNALVASMERVWMHRMTVVLVPREDDWAVVSLQVTPVQP